MQIAGKTLLEHVYAAAPEPKVVALAFPEPELYEFCLSKGLNFVRCYVDPADVLGRYVEALGSFHMEEPGYVLRLTADCPMLTTAYINRFLALHLKSELPENAILTNRPYDSDGFDMELFSARALLTADEQATDPEDREHVTPWLYRHLHTIRIPVVDGQLWQWSQDKVSVDTPEEFEYVKQLMEDECQKTP